jgi:hypothetical protein
VGIPEDIPISVRNKLYVQFNRRMESELKRVDAGTNVIPLEVLESYETTKNSREKKFILFKKFVEDPTMLSVFVSEKHEKTNVKSNAKLLWWRTRYQLELDYKAATNPKGMKMVEDVCRKAVETKQHDDHPDDLDWKLFLVTREVTQGEKDEETHSTAVTVAGEVKDKKAAEALMKEMAAFGLKVKAKAKGKKEKTPPVLKRNTSAASVPGTPVPDSDTGTPAKKIKWSTELHGLTTRLLKLTKNTNDLRGRKNLNTRDAATIVDMDARIVQLTDMESRFKAIVMSVTPAAPDVLVRAMEDKASFHVILKDDETFLAERLRRLNKAADA